MGTIRAICEGPVRFFSDVKNWYSIITNVKDRYQFFSPVCKHERERERERREREREKKERLIIPPPPQKKRQKNKKQPQKNYLRNIPATDMLGAQ